MAKTDFFVGEALLGEGENLAHIDLMIGSKAGPVGSAFANALTQLSKGHTPLLACIRPNLLTKPQTIIIPKVTLENMDDTNKIFGPAQMAVAKGIADALEEGIIPIEKVDEWVICASVFIHPKAEDYRKIYHYNYAATKLAIRRALKNYPPLKKLFYDKDRARHANRKNESFKAALAATLSTNRTGPSISPISSKVVEKNYRLHFLIGLSLKRELL